MTSFKSSVVRTGYWPLVIYGAVIARLCRDYFAYSISNRNQSYEFSRLILTWAYIIALGIFVVLGNGIIQRSQVRRKIRGSFSETVLPLIALTITAWMICESVVSSFYGHEVLAIYHQPNAIAIAGSIGVLGLNSIACVTFIYLKKVRLWSAINSTLDACNDGTNVKSLRQFLRLSEFLEGKRPPNEHLWASLADFCGDINEHRRNIKELKKTPAAVHKLQILKTIDELEKLQMLVSKEQ